MAYAKFTPEMKKTYTILAPNMLPIHFHLLIRILEQFGYHVVLLESTSRTVVEEGLKNVHNDTCYPALLVVGQFMEALKSGKYDVDHTALLITQTGGGCRASNYIHLLRKCMAEQFPQVPVLSLNFAGLEKDCSLELTPALCLKMVYAVLYADLLMTLYNQCRPYELNEGESQQVLDAWQEKLPKLFESNKFLSAEKIYTQILKDFDPPQQKAQDQGGHYRRDLRQVFAAGKQSSGGLPHFRGLRAGGSHPAGIYPLLCRQQRNQQPPVRLQELQDAGVRAGV